MKVTRSLLREIDRNHGRLVELRGNNIRNLMYNRREAALQHLAFFHSTCLELPVEAGVDLRGKVSASLSRHSRTTLKQSYDAVRMAWQELQTREDMFEEPAISRANYVVLHNGEGLSGAQSMYRRARVTLNLHYCPPNPDKVDYLMKGLVWRLNAMVAERRHPVEVGIEAHFGITAIQPFNDGNKRTSRLVEARHLEKHTYPVPIIPFGERNLYIDLFDSAACKAQEDPLRQVHDGTEFADYVACKVNSSLERMLGRDY